MPRQDIPWSNRFEKVSRDTMSETKRLHRFWKPLSCTRAAGERSCWGSFCNKSDAIATLQSFTIHFFVGAAKCLKQGSHKICPHCNFTGVISFPPHPGAIQDTVWLKRAEDRSLNSREIVVKESNKRKIDELTQLSHTQELFGRLGCSREPGISLRSQKQIFDGNQSFGGLWKTISRKITCSLIKL